ncbi:MAG: hypothetical protein IJK06_10990, partial [Clostridia bacterium]|nr:hypothetical protein [Clostridia bacterium]
MKHRSKQFLSILLSLVMVLGLVPGMSLTVLAETEQSETIATKASTVNGTHFTISCNIAYSTGMKAYEGNGGITVTPKNNEYITKVEITCASNPGYVTDTNTTVSSGTVAITDGGGKITVTDVNASTFNFKCGSSNSLFNQFVVYYLDSPPVASVTSSGGTATNYTNFAEAVTAWSNAGNGATLTLLSNVTTFSTIDVSGKTMTLDLNGYGILSNNTRVIYVQNGAELTINDSNPTREHYIKLEDYLATEVRDTGSQSITDGTGTVKVSGGYIAGGQIDWDGSFLYTYGMVTLNAGTIIGNRTIGTGSGAVYVRRNGSFIMNGGSIVYNKAHEGAAVSLWGENDGTAQFTMNGGRIAYNAARQSGGAVRLQSGSTFTMAGGSITDNRAEDTGGAIYWENGNNISINLSGSAVIENNHKGSSEENIYLYYRQKITVNGSLTDDASIGVTMEEPMEEPGVFTSSTGNAKAKDYAAKFTSDVDAYQVLVEGDELKLAPLDPVASVTPSGGTATTYTDFVAAVNAWSSAGKGATLKLLADVETNSSINVNNGYGNPMILDLNGYGIRRNGTTGSVIRINDGGSLKLTDSDGSSRKHYITLDENGRGISVADRGTPGDSCVEVTGGYITGGLGVSGLGGGGVWSISGFTMEGGTIIGNTTSPSGGDGQGGGVYVGIGRFTMTGGTITRNRASTSGGGVYVSLGGDFKLSGNAVIKDNLKGTDKDNVYLSSGRKITITDALTNSDPIGVTMQTPGVFTDGGKAKGYAAKFTSDNTAYSVMVDGDELKLSSHTHSFTYSASGATLTATCTAEGCDLPPSTQGGTDHAVSLTLSATDASYTGSAYAEASLSDTTAWTGAGLTAPTIEYAGRSSTSYTKSTTAPTAAGTYTASITADKATAKADFTISPIALTIDAATATNRAYDKDSTAVTISAVTFKDSSSNPVALTLDTDYTVTGAMTDANAGDGKTVTVTVTLKNGNYSLATNTTTTTVDISKAGAQTIADVTDTLAYTATSVSESVAGKMPEDAGTLSYTAGDATKTGSVTVSGFAVDENGAVTATLSGGAVEDTVTLPVTISSTNYADSNVNVVITLTDKGIQTITADPVTVTYGDTDKAVSATVTDPAEGGGTISYTVKDGSGDYIEVNAETGALTIKKVPENGTAIVTATAAETPAYAAASTDVTVTIEKADAVPATVTANNRDFDGTDQPLVTVTGEAVGGEMQYAIGTATEATGTYAKDIPTATDAGTYYVWYKVVGDENHKDTAPAYVTTVIKGQISATVTFKVENGSWNDGEGEAATADRIVTLTGYEGDVLKLTAEQIPAVGSKPQDGYKAGNWDVTPSTETAITQATTYTYTYAAQDAAVVTKAPTAKELTAN